MILLLLVLLADGYFNEAISRRSGAAVQIWLSIADGAWAEIHDAVAAHKHNLTDVSPYGVLTLHDGTLEVNATLANRAAHLGRGLGLGVWPLIGGGLAELRDVNATHITESVALAKRYGWRGYNLDFEVGTSPPSGCGANDTKHWLATLDLWAAALQAEGKQVSLWYSVSVCVYIACPPPAALVLQLQLDVGGCNDPYKVDYCGISCAQLAASKLDRLVTMDTYAGDVACGGDCFLNKSLALDVAALCSGAHGAECRQLQVGLMWQKPGKLSNKTAAELIRTMSHIRAVGVNKLSLWVGPPSQVWWDAFGAFLELP